MAPPMPPIPAIVAVSNNGNGYWLATVIAAIPLGHDNLYAVVGIEPTSSPEAPEFFAATAGQSVHGHWTVDDMLGGGSLAGDDSLADAIHSMLAIRAHDAWPGGAAPWPAPSTT